MALGSCRSCRTFEVFGWCSRGGEMMCCALLLVLSVVVDSVP